MFIEMERMINEMYKRIEQVLEVIDTGGEQSKAFAEEIEILKGILGYPSQNKYSSRKEYRQDIIAYKLRQLALESKDLKANLPNVCVEKWLDKSTENPDVDIHFKDCDLQKLLRYIADVGVSSNI
jgi:hypothetical protein